MPISTVRKTRAPAKAAFNANFIGPRIPEVAVVDLVGHGHGFGAHIFFISAPVQTRMRLAFFAHSAVKKVCLWLRWGSYESLLTCNYIAVFTLLFALALFFINEQVGFFVALFLRFYCFRYTIRGFSHSFLVVITCIILKGRKKKRCNLGVLTTLTV